MKTVNSFDIFDTLLARTVPYPSEIFTLIEYNYPYKNFKKIRIEASKNSNGTFKDIYKQFQILTNETDENIKKLKKYEFKTEKLNTIPIMSNILNIKDNDIFISDMYLSRKKIRKLLDYHNINSNTKLYVSPYGKKSGEIWEKLTKIYDIKKHTGDNFHSDIIMANKYNIETTFTNLYKFNFLEEYLYKKDIEHESMVANAVLV
jgi:predicted HAD superfamily hydrolase